MDEIKSGLVPFPDPAGNQKPVPVIFWGLRIQCFLRFTLHSFRKGSDAQIQKSPLLLIIEERGFLRESVYLQHYKPNSSVTSRGGKQACSSHVW